jgi:hypothetical protein
MPSTMDDHIDLRLINSRTYKILFPFLVAVFLISYLLSFIFLWPLQWILGLVGLNLLVTLIVFVYSKNFKEDGRLLIDIQNIVIAQKVNQPLIVPIALLEDLKISRGATIHKSDNGIFPAGTHDNWITFTFDKQKYKLEFCILNQKENEKFELVMNRLRSTHPKFTFTSI